MIQLGAVAANDACVLVFMINGQQDCVFLFVLNADILNILCDYQFVFSVLDELYVSHHA